MDRRVSLIVHDVRSALNVGSLLRTADGLGVGPVYLTGYTPYPRQPDDSRLPHIVEKVEHRIKKTALGAEKSVDWHKEDDINSLIKRLKAKGWQIVGLEQTPSSVSLIDFKPSAKVVLIVGSEVGGLAGELLASCDQLVEIPMRGSKESFNVAVAAAIALYHLSLAA